ncbi:glycoside hydrolase family 3 protein [Streptomyces stelliscabiei]|uniref:glycoside hydrolase family 3 protein n=1 Tax=Streptomyces stelliscabiei TaxID=146820 RepID=UPI0029A359D8|nr:glycoside hydrolase family 3 N-terminal domain-containing protein [Streptomyces stelliscabiei]MDX2557878.1 glycoside hydrolase family 3 N-terminal domain-containing protein [Streptomyces stelliscabiei]MDX2612228.1 glycoside hydrolase family 3 N-terminal domain-containing protein [Streptomyces stelliscabiei]MDX2636566.1 glycoside hydrolase family 3 N-terminal domain-containing protein [Streptomyces stelliscabiei]MDX2666955.1 glycoside hydrolase family 3 N-terminal domain-containing protein [S
MTHSAAGPLGPFLPAALDEAAHRCLVAGFDGTTIVPDTLKRLIDRGLGGVILFTRNIRDADQVRELTGTLRTLRPDLLIAIDNEGGGIGHLVAAGAPEVPGSWALGVADDPTLTAACADALAGHLLSLGITVSYAPVADVQSRPENPIVRTRAFGGDPELVSRHLRAWIEATEARGVASCAKHFPGHGGTVTDSHHAPAVDPRPYHGLDLAPFRAAVDAGVPMLMSAHVVFPALDPDRPATLSPRILTELLRGELGFDGVLVSDALEMRAIADRYGEAAGARLALAAGADQVIVAVPDLEVTLACRDAVLDALCTGDLAEERVTEAAERVRRLALRYALPFRPGAVAAWDADAGLVAARRAVRRGGPLPRPVPGAHVVDCFPPPHPALNWGGEDLLTEVRTLDPTATGTAVAGAPDDLAAVVGEVLRVAEGRPLVVAVCDAELHPWQARLRDALLAARADALVVSTGLPEEGGAVAAHGRGRVNLRAAAEVLTGRMF